jgi:hypothetical protein
MKLRHLLPAAVAALALTACEPPPPVVRSPDSTWDAFTLTDDTSTAGTDHYLVAGDNRFTTVTGELANHGGNTRIGLVARSASTVDHGSCATVDGSTGDAYQQGLVLRWTGTQGITVTKGVWADVATVINVHTWDTTAPADNGRFTLVAQFTMSGLGWPNTKATPLPWRMCASALGSTVRFKVWPIPGPEPADDDPCCTGVTTVALTAPGRPGWYAGHLQPGHTLAYSDLTTEVIG